MKSLYTSVVALIIPYIVIFTDGLGGFALPESVNQSFFIASVFLSTPGLLIIGFVLCSRKLKADRLIGAISIVIAISYAVIVFWVMANGL